MKLPRDVSGEHLAEALCRTGDIPGSINPAAISSSKPENLHISELPFRITAFFELARSIRFCGRFEPQGRDREAIVATL
jgi:hypothetical protein